MKYPTNIQSAEIFIADHLADAHVARRYAYLSVAEKLAYSIANKAFTEPTIIRAGWVENRDPFLHIQKVRASIQIMAFKDWAIENLRAGQMDEWSKVLDIPLSNERIMLHRDSFLYPK